MKIINPTLFDIAALPLIGPTGRPMLTVIVKGGFVFENGHCDPDPQAVPIEYGDCHHPQELGGGVRYESDIVAFKPRTDIVLSATVHAPGGLPAEVVPVSIKVGPVEKQLMVFGDRYWNHAGLLRSKYTISAAKPFVRRPILYEEAFGGIDGGTGHYCAENLSGKGCYGLKPKRKMAGKPLPNIEDPRHLIKTLQDHPRPAGFGFYHRAWQPRVAYAGTYDAAWRRNRSPLPPEDFDARFNNGAHPDLQVEGYLKGGESVVLHNLTAEGETAFTLPQVRLGCHITRKAAAAPREAEKAPFNLDTVFIEPDRSRCCMVWRATVSLEDTSAVEIEQVKVFVA